MGLPFVSSGSRTTTPDYQSASPSPHIMNNSRSPYDMAVSDRPSLAATSAIEKAATVVSTEDSLQASDTDRSLQALNTLLAASYTQGYIARTASPSHTAVPIDVRYTSVLPPAIAEYAASYPLIAIASIGALGTAVLLGTGALTARILRRAMPARPSTELGNMERRLKVELFDLKRGVGGESAYTSHALEAIALKLDEGRLGMVVKQALEQVAAAKSSSAGSGMGEGLLNEDRDLNQVMASVQRLETVTLGILEEIRLLREPQGASSSTLSPDPQGVLSMGELSDMVERFQAQTRELNEGIPSAADEVESEKSLTVGALDVNEEHSINRAIYGYDIGAQEKAAAIVVDELGKVVKVKTRKTKGRVTVVEEDPAISSQSTSAASPAESDLTNDSPIQSEAPLHEFSPPKPAEPLSTSEQVPLLNQAETSDETATTEAEPTAPAKRRYRKRTPLPATASGDVAEDASRSAPWENLPASSAASPRLGVDNDGTWSFQVMTIHPVAPNRGWHKTELLVTRYFSVNRGMQTWGPNETPIRFDSIERSDELVRAPVFHNPGVDLVILDGGAWQCHSLGRVGEYTIGVRLGDA